MSNIIHEVVEIVEKDGILSFLQGGVQIRIEE